MGVNQAYCSNEDHINITLTVPLIPDTHSWADEERNGYSAPEHGEILL